MIDNNSLIEILREWSFWDRQVISSQPRMVDLPKQLTTDLVLIIQGVRRCGKTTLLIQMPERYGLALESCFYCNFEDPRLLGSLDHNLLSQIVLLARKKIPQEKSCYFFFDEIQNVSGWEKWINSKLERPSNNYFTVTGSNSCLLGGELATALTGRHISVELFPFSFMEFKKIFSDKTIEDYFISGGFPRPLTYEQPHRLLQEYFNDIILRDVIRRIQARGPDAIKQVIKMAFDSCGSELSYRKLAATTGLSVETVKSYLEASEQAYLIFECPYFAFSEKKRLLKQKKYYPIDSGLRSAVSGTSGRDLGKNLEIIAYLHLRQLFGKVYYWSEVNHGDVDFVIKDGENIIPYQVTWNGPELRHEKSLKYFYEAFPFAGEAIYITKDNIESFLKQ